MMLLFLVLVENRKIVFGRPGGLSGTSPRLKLFLQARAREGLRAFPFNPWRMK
jgi:hypothetical protein